MIEPTESESKKELDSFCDTLLLIRKEIEDIENKKISVLVRQIAGLVARRIINYSKVGSEVNQCDQLGFIKFGSRADIYLPLGTKVNIKINQKTIAGDTEIASLY